MFRKKVAEMVNGAIMVIIRGFTSLGMLVSLLIFICFVVIVAVLESITVVVLGFLVGLISNKYPEWAKAKATQGIFRLYKRYSEWSNDIIF